jgi:hypothetical protein
VLIGILEGVAEATAGLSKGYFGRSDVTGVLFVQLGYTLVRFQNMMAVFIFPLWFLLCTIDRFEKDFEPD